MKRLGNKQGFTLVEIIVVLVILAILAAVFIPSLTGYIRKSQRAAVQAECRMAVIAAQTLYSESLGAEVTVDSIKALSEVTGEISGVEIAGDGASIEHLTYTKNGISCTYCRDYSSCDKHGAAFSFDDEENNSNGEDPNSGNEENKPGEGNGSEGEETPPTNSKDIFYIGGDSDYGIGTYGDLLEYVNVNKHGNSGGLNIKDKIVYWQGDYYVIRYNEWFGSDTVASDVVSAINSDSMIKIDYSGLKEAQLGVSKAGDLRLNNGVVEIYLPDKGYDNDSWNFNRKWVSLSTYAK